MQKNTGYVRIFYNVRLLHCLNAKHFITSYRYVTKIRREIFVIFFENSSVVVPLYSSVSGLVCVGCAVSYSVAFRYRYFKFTDDNRRVHLVVSSSRHDHCCTACLDSHETLSTATRRGNRPRGYDVRHNWLHLDVDVRRALRHPDAAIVVPSVFVGADTTSSSLYCFWNFRR